MFRDDACDDCCAAAGYTIEYSARSAFFRNVLDLPSTEKSNLEKVADTCLLDSMRGHCHEKTLLLDCGQDYFFVAHLHKQKNSQTQDLVRDTGGRCHMISRALAAPETETRKHLG